MIRFRFLFSFCCFVAVGCGFVKAQEDDAEPEESPPIQALMVTGGCCHDYETQKAILSAGIGERVKKTIEWTIVHQGQGESDVKIPLFEDADWAEGYDIVVHNYCFTRISDSDYVERILAPHRAGTPAVLIHGTMHSFRPVGDRWFEFCGVASPGHGSHHAFEIEPLIPDNPVFGATDHWATPRGELYFIEKVWPGVEPLAEAVSADTGEKEVVAWTHQYGPEGARVFGTTMGNFSETMIEPRFLDMVTRGFLWALEKSLEEEFLEVSPDESLRSITLKPDAPELPSPGRNLATGGVASAMSESEDGKEKASFASDGDVSTLWQAETPGPTSWRVALPDQEPIGAVALIWSEDPPPVYLVEGSNDLLDWQPLASLTEGERPAQIAIHETEGDCSHLRVSVERTRAGQTVGLREFAAYRDAADVPAAVRLAAEIAPGKRTDELRLVGESDLLPEGVKLAEKLEVIAVAGLPSGFRARQLLPTASGAVFVLVAADDKASAGVVMVSRSESGELTTRNFLTGLDPDTTIAWDGEWVYTLEQSRLTAYRDTDRNGLADERFRHGRVFSPAEEDSGTRIDLSEMRLGMDGRFYVVIDAGAPVQVQRKDGTLVDLPSHGMLSFTLAGEDLDVVFEAESAMGEIHGEVTGTLYFQRQESSGRYLLEDIREVTSLGDISMEFPDEERGELIGIGSGGDFWIKGEDQVFRLARTGEKAPVAIFPMLEKIQPSTLGNAWAVYRDEENDSDVIALVNDGSEFVAGVNMDLQRQGDLIDLLGSRSAVVRKEARYEVLRRRRFPQNHLLAVLTDSNSPEARVAAMSALNEAAGEIFIPHLAKLARDTAPEVRAAAFRALGRYDAVKNHAVFGAISEETRPEVTSAILAAILSTGTDAPGIDALVLQFAASENPILAASAQTFLIRREASEVCFAALGDDSQEQYWATALSILAAMERQSIVEGIALRLEQTRSPKLRRLALETLTDLYFREGGERWEGTRIAELMLGVSVADHRVDRAFLLDRMMSEKIPLRDTVQLVKLGKENLPLEGAVIELLLEREAPIYAEDWLLEVAQDPDRDGDLRLNALALLGTIKSPPLLREVFPLLADRASLNALPETEVMALNRWITNPAHLANFDWTIDRARAGDSQQGSLAWHTLLSVLDDPGLDAEAVERAKSAMLSTVASSEEKSMQLLDALADSAYSGRDELLEEAAKSENIRVKKTAVALADSTEIPVDDDLIADVEKGQLVGRAGELDGDIALGKTVFERVACGDCHNIHGEGLSLAPDLASRAKDQSLEALADAILNPDKNVVEGYATTRYLLKDGTVIHGHPEDASGDSITLLDSAGNRAEVPEGRVAERSETGDSIMRSDLTRTLTIYEFASLLQYVKSLAADQ